MALGVNPVIAAVGFTSTLERIDGEDWSASGVTLAVQSVDAGRMAVDIRVAGLQLPDGIDNLTDLRFACAEALRDGDGWHCEQGTLSTASASLGQQQASWSGYWRDDGSLRLDVDGLKVAGGSVATAVSLTAGSWEAGIRAYRLRVRDLAKLGGVATGALGADLVGRVSGAVDLRGGPEAAETGRAELVVDGLGFASPDGGAAAENMVVRLDTDFRRRGGGWNFDSRLRWPSGALYLEPVFIDAAQGALQVDVAGTYAAGRNAVDLDAWRVHLAEALSISGTGRIDTATPRVVDLTVAAHSDNASRLYELLVQPFLIGTPGDDLDVSGQVGFVLHFDASGPEQAGLDFTDLALSDRRGRFALGRTNGSLAWARDERAPLSALSIDGVSWLKITSGPFAIRTRLAGERARLTEPVVVPLLGGQVRLDDLALNGIGLSGVRPSWTASAALQGISLDQLTRELDWPPFNGDLSGEFKQLSYKDGTLRVDGGVLVHVFDGSVTVDDLLIQEPLGSVPVLKASADMRGLNLEAVTRTFSFGRITGRLDGKLDNLQMVAWQPAAFDLHLYTPTADDSRRRISQRAVENLTELGSGLPGGLSGSFLGIFEEFAYSAIDINVLLNGRLATISGLAREDGGYYLVRGSGLPRIDVIGRNRSVDWNELLGRLRDIRVEGVEIQ